MWMNRRWHVTNVVILVAMIIIPSIVLASVPTTTSFDRQNIYYSDGYRDGGYYAVRHDPAVTGFMNMTHVGGTNVFTIESYNIKNITLDMDLMFEQRKALFGWDNVTWEDMVSSLGNEIVINVDSADGIDSLRFIDHPNVAVQVKVDGEIHRTYATLGGVEVDSNTLGVGDTQVILQFDAYQSLYDIMLSLLAVIIVLGIILMVVRSTKRVLFYDGTYYKSFWGDK